MGSEMCIRDSNSFLNDSLKTDEILIMINLSGLKAPLTSLEVLDPPGYTMNLKTCLHPYLLQSTSGQHFSAIELADDASQNISMCLI